VFHVLSERVVHAIWGFFVWFFLGVLALAVISSQFIWELPSPQPCFDCDRGVETFQVDPATGKMTDVPNSLFFITNTEVGDVQSLAISH